MNFCGAEHALVAIVGTVGVPACYGGFETLVDNLLGENDPEILVYCSAPSYPERRQVYKNAKLVYLPLKANGIQSVFYDIASILDAVRRGSRKILVLGVSGAPIIPVIKLFRSNIHFITNIDGIEWRRQKWGVVARAYLKYAERMAVRYSDVVVCDNQAILDHVEKKYGKTGEVIAYGGDHAVIDSTLVEVGGYALALCRIEMENNVHTILSAFKNSTKRLKFVGNWSSSVYGKSLRDKYSHEDNIEILDPIYDVNKLCALRAGCDMYIHGHEAGGTNPSLVEIMHFAKPVLAYDCRYNRETTENKGIYFSNSNELRDLLEKPISEYSEIGVNMLEIARRRYMWSIVKMQYFSLLNSIGRRGGDIY